MIANPKAEACVSRVADTLGPMLRSGAQETIVIVSYSTETRFEDGVAVAPDEETMWAGISCLLGGEVVDMIKRHRPGPLSGHCRLAVVSLDDDKIAIHWAHARMLGVLS